MLDPEDEGNTPKRVRRADNKPSDNKPSDKGKNNKGGSKPSGWCWDCGETGHMRNKCPEHFKFKPKPDSDGEPTEPEISQEGNAEGSQ